MTPGDFLRVATATYLAEFIGGLLDDGLTNPWQ